MNPPVYADNCQVCGQEHLNIELLSVKLGNKSLSRILICLGCMIHIDTVKNDYQSAIDLLTQISRFRDV